LRKSDLNYLTQARLIMGARRRRLNRPTGSAICKTQLVDINHGGNILQPDAIYNREQSSGVQDERAVMVYTTHKMSRILMCLTYTQGSLQTCSCMLSCIHRTL